MYAFVKLTKAGGQVYHLRIQAEIGDRFRIHAVEPPIVKGLDGPGENSGRLYKYLDNLRFLALRRQERARRGDTAGDDASALKMPAIFTILRSKATKESTLTVIKDVTLGLLCNICLPSLHSFPNVTNKHCRQVHKLEKEYACTVAASGIGEGVAAGATLCIELTNWRTRRQLRLKFRVATTHACCVGHPEVEVSRRSHEGTSSQVLFRFGKSEYQH